LLQFTEPIGEVVLYLIFRYFTCGLDCLGFGYDQAGWFRVFSEPNGYLGFVRGQFLCFGNSRLVGFWLQPLG
jgi:hypothetical protein